MSGLMARMHQKMAAPSEIVNWITKYKDEATDYHIEAVYAAFDNMCEHTSVEYQKESYLHIVNTSDQGNWLLLDPEYL